MTTSKRCLTCGETKPLTDFSTNGTPADRITQAYRPNCRRCSAEHHRRVYAARSPEQIEKDKQRRRAEYLRHREKHDIAGAAWREANPEKVQAIRQAAQRRYRQRNLNRLREEGRRQQLARRVGKRPEDVEYGDLLLRDPCSYCGEPATTIDHIEPLALGGENRWENLTAACASCNSRKRHHPLLVFLAAA